MIPEYLYIVFQATFAAITVALIVGAFAERMKFSAVLLFAALWFTFAYLPIAHMVWFWPGPDGIKDAATLASETAKGGWLWQKGALDFAGGTVVHINAGVAGLVGAFVIGKRVGYGKDSMAPHNLTFTMIGASLLWVGWFGFNAGSALEAGDIAALAFINTLVATAAAVLSWMGAEWLLKGKPSMLGAASGAVAGLVAITPACGFVGVGGALILGLLAGVVCLWGVNGLKRKLGADDALDVFGVHAVGGILGAMHDRRVRIAEAWAVRGSTITSPTRSAPTTRSGTSSSSRPPAWLRPSSGPASWRSSPYKIVDMAIGLRVTEEEEREGLDISSHGESAYRI